MVGLFETQDLAPGPVPFNTRKTALCEHRCVMIGTASREKLKSWLMWWAQMYIVINHNACRRTRLFGKCIFYLVRGLCECECSHWVQCWSRPLFHLIPPHFSSLVSKTLTTCTSSTLQKPRRQEEGSPLLLNISPIPFLSSWEQRRFNLLSYQQRTKFTLNSLSTLPSAQLTHDESSTFQWQLATITRDLLSRHLHNPHGSMLQPPGGTVSCGEHLFNLSSSWNGVSVTQWL